MSTFSLETIDSHIFNLQAQLQFLQDSLDATDHTAPDWLATDLVSLRNKSGRLYDDMKRFSERLENEGLVSREKVKESSNKRLSIEGRKTSSLNAENGSKPSFPSNSQSSPPISQQPPPPPPPPQPQQCSNRSTSYVQHIDVTEEVNRRLRESRLRRLMDSPSTAQKRKFDAFEDTRRDSEPETEYGGDNTQRTPTKRIKSSGGFEQVHLLKRKETGIARGDTDERLGEGLDFKKRKT